MKNEFIPTKDWNIDGETFSIHFAKLLSKNPKRIGLFKKRIIKEYNETKDLAVFFRAFKNCCNG
jgi:hypothetical protein